MKKRLFTIGFLVLILNLIWEFSHYRLYNDLSSITGPTHLIIAGFGDVVFVFFILGLISVLNKNVKWIKNPSKKHYVLFAVFAMAIAVIIEVVNVKYLGRWSYKPAMPTIFGIGLSPLVQLAITGSFSLWISGKLKKYI